MRLHNHMLMLAALLVATFGAAAIGCIVTSGSVRSWYPALVKSAWNPPAWLVWRLNA